MTCDECRAFLEARANARGELPAEVASHLAACPACRAEEELDLALIGARALASRPLAQANKERIFAAVAASMVEAPRAVDAPDVAAGSEHAEHPVRASGVTPIRRRARRPIAVAIPIALAAAAGLLLWVWAAGSDGPAPMGRWLTQKRGVHAWIEGDGDVRFLATGATAIEVTDGTVLVELDHARASGPLVVRTRDAEVWVRGTIFYVSCAPGQPTRVGVRRGRVEVRAGEDVELVERGQGALAEHADVRAAAPARAAMRRLGELFGGPEPLATMERSTSASPPEEPSDAADDPEIAVATGTSDEDLDDATRSERETDARSGRALRRAAERRANAPADEAPVPEAALPAPEPSVADQLARARALGSGGQDAAAERILRSLLASDRLGRDEREEALYLLSNSLRAQRRYREAADVLGRLADSSGSRAARLARIERARLLAYNLDDVGEAQRLLDRIVSEGGSDSLTREAGVEACFLRLERGDRDGADRCLTQLVERFPTVREHSKVRLLQRRLGALRE
ncbi:MAG: FecR domain-containing protein [Sandaracinaceae bacterium]